MTEPRLAPPGAGLPKIELVIARLIFNAQRLAGNRKSFTARFLQERAHIRRLLEGLPGESSARRVLIRRLPGLEDSSRYWSVWMTLDHLRLIHQTITGIISSLAKGATPPGAVSTAAVKPDPTVTGEVVAKYEKSCDDLLAAIAAAGNLKTSVRHAHPWFGSLNAAGWHAMAPMHLAIHRVQIERIIEGLRSDQV